MLLSIGIRIGDLRPEKDSIKLSMIEHIKSVFRIDQLPIRGFLAISAIVLLSVLLYKLMV
jgi:hypothetical protein